MIVLVVDDDKMVLTSCRRVLEAEGHQVRQAFNAETAVEAVLEGKVDLVLADVMMPGQDGFELMKRLRRAAPGLPVILMTGYLTPQVEQRGLDAGAAAFIAKPFTPDELLEGIARAVGAA